MKLYILQFTLIASIMLTSCDGTKKTSENQSAANTNKTTSTEVPVSNSPVTDTAKEKMIEADNRRTDKATNPQKLTGAQIIENMTNRLISKLTLTAPQGKNVKEILTSTYLELGNDLQKTFTLDETKALRRTLVEKSKPAINAILDATQKANFEKLGHHE